VLKKQPLGWDFIKNYLPIKSALLRRVQETMSDGEDEALPSS
jgi:hypothetical protein